MYDSLPAGSVLGARHACIESITACVQVSKPDNLPTPEFGIMKKYKDWEIRR